MQAHRCRVPIDGTDRKWAPWPPSGYHWARTATTTMAAMEPKALDAPMKLAPLVFCEAEGAADAAEDDRIEAEDDRALEPEPAKEVALEADEADPEDDPPAAEELGDAPDCEAEAPPAAALMYWSIEPSPWAGVFTPTAIP